VFLGGKISWQPYIRAREKFCKGGDREIDRVLEYSDRKANTSHKRNCTLLIIEKEN
jgi:hypothetical protein